MCKEQLLKSHKVAASSPGGKWAQGTLGAMGGQPTVQRTDEYGVSPKGAPSGSPFPTPKETLQGKKP